MVGDDRLSLKAGGFVEATAMLRPRPDGVCRERNLVGVTASEPREPRFRRGLPLRGRKSLDLADHARVVVPPRAKRSGQHRGRPLVHPHSSRLVIRPRRHPPQWPGRLVCDLDPVLPALSPGRGDRQQAGSSPAPWLQQPLEVEAKADPMETFGQRSLSPTLRDRPAGAPLILRTPQAWPLRDLAATHQRIPQMQQYIKFTRVTSMAECAYKVFIS